MEIIESKSANLSNYEVLNLLQNIKLRDGRNQNGALATITYETVKYLENTPCSLQDQNVIEVFLKSVQKFKLTKSERLLILNTRPTTPVEIQLIVQDIETRLNEEQTEELISVVTSLLPEKME